MSDPVMLPEPLYRDLEARGINMANYRIVKPIPLEATTELLRTFHTIDMVEGALYRHEVRRDPVTGLTLTTKQPAPTNPKEKPQQ